jgi:hypothetical protein
MSPLPTRRLRLSGTRPPRHLSRLLNGLPSIRQFLTTTHRAFADPNAMPNPQLLDFQITQLTAYILSLRNVPKAQAEP